MNESTTLIVLSLLSPIAILVAACLAFYNHQRTAARRAALEFVSKTQLQSQEWTDLNRNYRELQTSGKLLSTLSKDHGDPVLANRICLFLNHFELVAVAIKHNIIDKNLYAEWFKGSYVKTWNETNPFVAELRRKSGNSRVFIEFEALAKEWSEQAEF